jgi:glycosyltransferase involved in cell wall biosynthesis
MRILLSAYACRPNAGSEPACGWNWATHLAARGIEVHVLVAGRNREAIEAGLRSNPIANLHFTYVHVPYGWTKKNEAFHYVCWQAAALKEARKLATKFQFHLVHHVTYASVHVPSPLWRLGIPVVFGPVGGGQTAPASMLKYFGADKSREQLRSSLTRALRVSFFHRHSLRKMSWVLAANCDTLNMVRALGCKNTSLMCDTAVPMEYLAEGPVNFEERPRALRLLWVGRMLTRKALPLALDALKKVRRDVSLTIAGDGMDPETVRKMIRDRNLEHKVFWKGSRLTWKELRTAYSEHDAMLFTSLRDSFGSQLVEALAMGLPIITLDLHGARDFVPDAASFKVAVGTPQETVRNLANAIEKYALLLPLEKNQMSAIAWNFARTRSWSARAELVEKLYEQVLSEANPYKSAAASKMATVGA